MIKKVCIFGSYRDLPQSEKAVVVALGRALAEAGYTVVSGGFGGTMEDIAAGAKEGGGRTIGVTYYKKGRPGKPNEYIDEEIRAASVSQRIEIMMYNCDAFIVFPGGTGTLLELATLLEFINKGLLSEKPILAIGDYWEKVLATLQNEMISSQEVSDYQSRTCNDLVTFLDGPEQVLSVLEEQLGEDYGR